MNILKFIFLVLICLSIQNNYTNAGFSLSKEAKTKKNKQIKTNKRARPEKNDDDLGSMHPKKKFKSNLDYEIASNLILLNIKDPVLKKAMSLQQDDGWRCGYFATFNAFSFYKILNKKDFVSIKDALKSFDLTKLDWGDFEKNYILKLKEIKDLYENKEMLGGGHIELLLSAVLKVDNFQVLKNVSIIEYSNFDSDKLYPDFYVLSNIENLRKNNIPQIILLNLNMHWTAWIIDRKNIYGANSLKEYNCGLNKAILRVFNYFNYQVLPMSEKITQVIKKIKTCKGNIKDVELFARQNGFTKKQFEQLKIKYFDQSLNSKKLNKKDIIEL